MRACAMRCASGKTKLILGNPAGRPNAEELEQSCVQLVADAQRENNWTRKKAIHEIRKRLPTLFGTRSVDALDKLCQRRRPADKRMLMLQGWGAQLDEATDLITRLLAAAGPKRGPEHVDELFEMMATRHSKS